MPAVACTTEEISLNSLNFPEPANTDSESSGPEEPKVTWSPLKAFLIAVGLIVGFFALILGAVFLGGRLLGF